MAINLDKPHRWKADIAASVDQFNAWFLVFAPKAYRDSRAETTNGVEHALSLSDNLRTIDPDLLREHPRILQALRMACCPPLARDRLIGLAHANRHLVKVMEEQGRLSRKMPAPELAAVLERLAGTIARMIDRDIFPWIETGETPGEQERYRASTIVADRLCGAVSDPIIRNAQERRQLDMIGKYLTAMGYHLKGSSPGKPLRDMEAGTYSVRTNVPVGGESRKINIPIDVVVQPRAPRANRLPVLIEAKSAGDFANVNKRRKEEATKMRQLRETYGPETEYLLFLCGYFDSGYLGYEAAEGIDWIWEHRIEDFEQLGL